MAQTAMMTNDKIPNIMLLYNNIKVYRMDLISILGKKFTHIASTEELVGWTGSLKDYLGSSGKFQLIRHWH